MIPHATTLDDPEGCWWHVRELGSLVRIKDRRIRARRQEHRNWRWIRERRGIGILTAGRRKGDK